MQKIVAFVLCMTLIASTQAFIGGNDGLNSLMFYNMMSGRPLLDFNLFGMNTGASAAGQTTGQRGAGAQAGRTPQGMCQDGGQGAEPAIHQFINKFVTKGVLGIVLGLPGRRGGLNLFSLALLNEAGMF